MQKLILSAVFAAAMLGFQSVSHADDLHDFTILNSTGDDIREVYLIGPGETDWGKDIMGPEDVIPVGKSQEITVHGYKETDCQFKVKIVDGKDNPWICGPINMCESSSVKFSFQGKQLIYTPN